jgi:hypothetical protein
MELKECSICLEQTDELFVMCCKQHYHPGCLYLSLKYDNKCPICKAGFAEHTVQMLGQYTSNPDDKKLKYDIMTTMFSNNNICWICYKPVMDNITCGDYKYHLQCLRSWDSCPNCNSKLTDYAIFKIYTHLSNHPVFTNYLCSNNHDYHYHYNNEYLNRRIKRIRRNNSGSDSTRSISSMSTI